MKKSFTTLLIAIGLIGSASADYIFNDTFTYGSAWNELGYRFHVGSDPIQVTALGVPWYSGKTGYNSVIVAIQSVAAIRNYNYITNDPSTFLGSAIININGASSGFVWSNISPLNLQQNTDYLLVEYGASYLGADFGASSVLNNPSTSSSLITLNGSIKSGTYSSIIGNTQSFFSGNDYQYVGPNMQFAAIPSATPAPTPDVVPEPSTYALLGIGAIGLLMVMRRKQAI
jgi:hypothetical protein